MDQMATTLILIAVVISGLLALHAALNSFWLIKPVPVSISESVCILIPARNEELNISECVTSALNQEMLANFEVVVLDDDSSDATLQTVSGIQDPRLAVMSGAAELPVGWLGKNWACHRLAETKSADYLVFLDCDVVLEATAVASAISAMQKYELDLVSPYPRQIATTSLARLVQPLLQWSWLTTVPLFFARKTSRSSLAVANGQFLVCKNTSYQSAGGHASVKAQVFDDIELLRSFYRSGLTGSVIDGSKIATCHMYRADQDLISGYAKSLWKAFGGIFGTIFVNVFFIFVYVFPLTGLFTGQASLAVTAFGFGLISRLISARVSGSRVLPEVLWHPISILAFTWLNCVSWWRHLRGTNTWKSRDLK
jgi:glycosyltransferase involved in cell wall biosynthesis